MNPLFRPSTAARLATVVGLTALAAPALAQVEFTPRDIFNGASGANSAFAVDVDGDGDTDVLSTSLLDNTIRWYENNGAVDPTFTPHNIFSGASFATSVFAADVDGDGDTDVLSASAGDHTIRWYENDGAPDPTFTPRSIFTGANGAFSVFASDVDGDGDTDVLSASRDDSAIRWYENNGAADPTFTPHNIFGGASFATSVLAADVDGDGDTDILSTSFGDDTVRWYENDGAPDPSFTPRSIFTGANGAFSVFASDVDGDGDTDVLSASTEDNTFRWYENDGAADPTFTARTIFNGALSPAAVVAADVDGDGDTDVLSASSLDNTIRWYENDGAEDPTFTTRTIFNGADRALSVFAADLDGDGDTDVLSASQIDSAIRWYEIELLVRNTTAMTSHTTIADAIDAASPGDDLLAFTANFTIEPVIDFTGKGISLRSRDAISQNASGVYTLADDAVLAAAPGADMDLSGRTTAPVGAFAFLAGERFSLKPEATLDMGFGSGVFIDAPLGATIEPALDLASNSSIGFSGDLFLLANPEFAEPNTIFSNAAGALSIVAADVDGDGDTDVLSASEFDNAIRWYENDGAPTPTFTPRDIFTSAVGAGSVFTADVDGDGDTDVLSISSIEDVIRWHENDGAADPTFAARVISSDLVGAAEVIAADVDGDGDTDVLSASFLDSTIRWYENDGATDPTFTARTIFTGALGAIDVFAADVDGDGDTDVISASNADNTIRWYENDGATDPTFIAREIFNDAGGAISVFAADVDGDGDTDVLSASTEDSTFRWYENDGAQPPAFIAREIFTGAAGARAVFAADVDADGDTDIVSASRGDNTIRWHENDGAPDPIFTARGIFTGAIGAVSVFAADVDGDGDADVLSASRSDNTIRMHRQSPSPAHSISNGAILTTGGAVFNAARMDVSGTLSTEGSITNTARLNLLDGTAAAEGGLTNRGAISGLGTIDASVLNSRRVTLQGATNVFGDYTNNGVTAIQNGTLTILGALTNSGEIIGDFAGLDPRGDREGGLFIKSDLAFGPGATMRMNSENARLSAGGNVDIAINSNTRYDMSLAQLRMVALGGTQSLEVMSVDIGNDVAGLDREIAGHYPIGTLRIGPTTTTVNLVDDRDNANDGQDNCEAIYVRNLVIDAGATLNANGCRVYYETLTLNGAVDDPDNLIQLGGSCPTDWDGNDVVNSADVGAFLTDYFEDLANGTLRTDFDNNGVVNAADVGAFLSQYFEDLVNPDCNGG